MDNLLLTERPADMDYEKWRRMKREIDKRLKAYLKGRPSIFQENICMINDKKLNFCKLSDTSKLKEK